MSLGTQVRQDLGWVDPREIPGLLGWYESDLLGGFGSAYPADYTQVPAWVDLSGNNLHLAQGIVAKQPRARRANINRLAPGVASTNTTTGWAVSASVVSPTPTILAGGETASVTGSALQWTQGAVARGFSTLLGVLDTSLPIKTGETWTLTLKIKLVSGTAKNAIIGLQNSDGSNQLTATTSQALTVSGSFVTFTKTFVAVRDQISATRLYIGTSVPSDDHVIRVCSVQLEKSATQTLWLPPGNYPGVQFDGTDDYIGAIAPAGFSGDRTMYSVVSHWIPVAGSGYVIDNYNTNNSANMVVTGGGIVRFINAVSAAGVMPIAGIQRVVSGRVIGTSYVVRVDGTVRNTATGAAPNDYTGIVLGVRSSLNQNFLVGLIRTVAVYRGGHNFATMRRIERMLAARGPGPLLAA